MGTCEHEQAAVNAVYGFALMQLAPLHEFAQHVEIQCDIEVCIATLNWSVNSVFIEAKCAYNSFLIV